MNINLVKTDLVTVEEMDFMQELWMFRFSNRVYSIYKAVTKKNKNIEYLEAKKKLIRDILLSREAPVINRLSHKRVFYYGNLTIQLNLVEHSICYVNNDRGYYKFELNEEKRTVLNEIMNIEERG